MDGHALISFLEGIRQDIPGPLQNDFEELIQLVRNIVDAIDQIITPPDVIHSGRQQLLTHHTTLTSHASTLQTNLADFQTFYTGGGSDAYHRTAYQALQQFNLLNDHLAFAMNAHDSIAIDLGNAQVAQDALIAIIGLLIVTTFLLPEGVPAYAAEGAGGGFSVAALWAALGNVGTTLAGLTTAALPYVPVTAAAFATATLLSGDSPTTGTITATSGILFSIKKETPDGRTIRVRPLKNREVKNLKTDDGKPFEQEKGSQGYPPKAEIFVDADGNYWIGLPGSDFVEPFP